MKWFKHDTDCYLSEGLNALLDKAGWEGYGRWFRLLEIVAAKMDNTEKCSATYPIKIWQQKLGFYHRKQFEDWVKIVGTLNGDQRKIGGNLCRIFAESSNNLMTISIPNLLKKRDEYSKKSGQKFDSVLPKNKEIRNKNKEIRKEEYSKDFLIFYNSYPNKKAPQEAWKSWLKISNRPPIEKIIEAINKQIEWRKNSNGQFRPEWKHPATWLNKGCWDDEIGEDKTWQTF
jgi:hypothetical protein